MSSGREFPSQVAGNHKAEKLDPFYTNEDVAVLHDIVVLAQELLPTLPDRERLPTNALFSAYHDILPRLGIDADHDSRYARVLFKIGGLRGEGTLYERFEEVLSRMGIEIEFDEEVHSSDYQDENAPADVEDDDAGGEPQNENIPQQGRPRRNSDSVWDVQGGNEAPKLRQRRRSHSPLNKNTPRPVLDRRHFQEPFKPQSSRRVSKPETQPQSNVGAWLNSSHPEPPRRHRGRSLSTQPSFRVHRRSPSRLSRRPAPTTNTSDPITDDYRDESDITAVTSPHEEDASGSIVIPHQHIIFKPSSRISQAEAEGLLQKHFVFQARNQIRAWRDKALRLQKARAKLGAIALRHDSKALLYQALDTWRGCCEDKRRIAETERFFDHQERKAERLRDLFILQKAFTHWHKSATREAERTQAARRHILERRIFNAWRDITVVNELKVRRTVCRKFFSIWKVKQETVDEHEASALQYFEENLVERVYKAWLEKAWSIKANSWWAEGVRQRALTTWVTAAREVLKYRHMANEEKSLQLVYNGWAKWTAKLEEHGRLKDHASGFRRTSLLSDYFRKWGRETQVIPAKETVQTGIATRLLRNTFAIWLYRVRQERQAATIDRSRMSREALTKWRHKGRFHFMTREVNRRLLWDGLVKWVSASRAIETRKDATRKLAKNAFHKWASKAKKLKRQEWSQDDLAEHFATQNLQRLVVMHWLFRSQTRQQLNADANDFQASRLLRRVISQWSEQAGHIRKLQQWSRDADFYFLTSKTLKRWKASTEESKREKRKAAYSQVRRTAKMSMARGILSGWRTKAQYIIHMNTQAQEINKNKVVIIGMNIFDRWRGRTEEIAEMEGIWRERLLKKHFIIWRTRSAAFQNLTVEAIINYQEQRQSKALKKWNLGMLQLRAQTIYAAEIQGKNAKRTFRKILSYWRQKASERRPIVRPQVRVARQTGSTARAEAWSDFGDEGDGYEWERGLDEAATSTPAPGYLNTPSRRTDRVAAAAARFSSTTPQAPLSTPFERQLRAQYSGGPILSLRKGLGRSMLSVGGGFADIGSKANDDGEKT